MSEEQKCDCGSTKDLIIFKEKVTCAVCVREMINVAAFQKIDVLNLDQMCRKVGTLLQFKLVGKTKGFDAGAIIADEVSKYFQQQHNRILSGKLRETENLQKKVAELRQRLSKADELIEKDLTELREREKTVKGMLEDLDSMRRQIEDFQSENDLKSRELVKTRNLRDDLRREESTIRQKLDELLGEI